jgi:DNA-directed RNA polymerase specialized sigma subunit, sigma24 homolog
MEFDEIVKKSGNSWTQMEVEFVFECLMQKPNIDSFIRSAYRRIWAHLKPFESFIVRDHQLTEQEQRDTFSGVVYELSKDLVEQKFYEFFRKLEHYDPSKYTGRKCPCRNYIFTIVIREARRRAEREIKRYLREEEYAKYHEARLRENLIQEEQIQEMKTRVLNCIKHQEMPDIYKEALSLRYLQGLPTSEAAVKANCSYGAFKVRLVRARQYCNRLLSVGGIK